MPLHDGGRKSFRIEPLQVYKSIRGPDAEKPVSSGIQFWKVIFVLVALVAMGFLVVLALVTG